MKYTQVIVYNSWFLNNSELILVVILGAWTVTKLSVNSYRRKNRSPFSSGSAILLSYYTETVKEMLPLHKGNIGEMTYSAIALMGNRDIISKHTTALIYMVELPFTTKLHLLGIPKKSGATQLNPTTFGGIMERVHLEGDYDNYFSLFCEKGMQTQARYIFDPKAMAFSVDFCQSHNWEIIGHELHFLQSDTTSSNSNPTIMFDDIQKFITEIRPVIADSVNEDNFSHLAPSVRIPRKKHHCPVCNEFLEEHSGYFTCPKEHGMLLQGFKLPLVKKGDLKNFVTPSKKHTRQDKILCPVCNNPMVHVPYGGSATIIDTCTKCPFRWLNAGELTPKP